MIRDPWVDIFSSEILKVVHIAINITNTTQKMFTKYNINATHVWQLFWCRFIISIAGILQELFIS